jgi:eukaryotic-like serine/threonine-protein kinase
MAPEQAAGTSAVDERADVFSLGSILCEILTGKPAFQGPSRVILHRKAAMCDLDEALEALENSGADDELIRLAKECLAAEPSDRPKNAGRVAERVEMYLASVRHRLRAAEIQQAKEADRAEESMKLLATERLLRIRTLLMSALIGLLFLAVGLGWLIRERGGPRSAAGVQADAANAKKAR